VRKYNLSLYQQNEIILTNKILKIMGTKFYKSFTDRRYVIELENCHYCIYPDTNEIFISNNSFVDAFNIHTECTEEEVKNVLNVIHNNLKQLF
jgi:hypothetical protein